MEHEDEEEDIFTKAEKFAKTQAYKDRCLIFREALFNVDLGFNKFVEFEPTFDE